ncbi:ATP-dependent helicase [Pontibacillus yanchengensis]|uniref:DNA 3'-5' helicase n=1 Tax=Pontibacillus yanchengensis Y32 TaxID=1385514 RepID=A0A0A2TFA5_9BACI|nr:ATP-dependent helicase [Pontibacillus yanchengensis]KGP74522.1 hypothetical protein N782_12720 [Pontibacillus yanchengensis Y32]
MNENIIEEIILDNKSSALVLAGPGAGKTRLIIRKLEILAQQDYFNSSGKKALVLTFNKKASIELQSRIEKANIPDSSFIEVFTYHGLGYKILRTYGYLIDISYPLKLFPIDERKALIKELESTYQAFSFDLFYQKYASIANEKDRERFVGKHAQEYADALCSYNSFKEEKGLIDYSDLISKCIELLQNSNWLRRVFQGAYPAILVDEFQDTDQLQFKMLMILGLYSNILSVADEDQIIYEFRGAEEKNINDFIDVFKASKYHLSYNHRSTNNIVQVANSLISNNTNRLSRIPMHTNNPDGSKIGIYMCSSIDEEVLRIKNLIIYWNKENKGNCAILFREKVNLSKIIISRVSKELDEVGVQTYELKPDMILKDPVVQWFIVALRFKEYLTLSLLSEFVLFLPGIGRRTQEKIYDYIRKHDDILYDDVDLALFFSKKQLYIVDGILNELFKSHHILDVFDLAYNKVSEKEKLKNKEKFYGNIRRVIEQETNGSAKELVKNYRYILDVNNLLKLSKNEVFIGTIHQVKGLEFENVVISGVSNGIFPKIKQGVENTIQEERRLFYVGITRAMFNLCITASREWFNPLEKRIERLEVSPFLRELPREYLVFNQ